MQTDARNALQNINVGKFVAHRNNLNNSNQHTSVNKHSIQVEKFASLLPPPQPNNVSISLPQPEYNQALFHTEQWSKVSCTDKQKKASNLLLRYLNSSVTVASGIAALKEKASGDSNKLVGLSESMVSNLKKRASVLKNNNTVEWILSNLDYIEKEELEGGYCCYYNNAIPLMLIFYIL